MSRAEMAARGWDAVDVVFVTGDAYVDHPSFAMAILARVLESAGFRVGDAVPAGLAECRPVAHLRAAASLLRDQRRQHGFDDQPLHGEPEGAQRRCLFARRAHRVAPRSRDARLLPACREAYPGRAGDRRRRRGLPPTPRPLRLLERHRARSIVLDAKADLSCSAWASTRSLEIARRLAAGRAPSRTSATCAASRMPSAPATLPASAMRAPDAADDIARSLPSFEEVAADKRAFSEATRDDPHETNPFNARSILQGTATGRSSRTRPTLPLTPGGDGPHLRSPLHAPRRTRATRRRSRPTR